MEADNRWRQMLWLFLLAIALRLFSAHFLTEFFQQNPLFSTPWNSVKRLREGLFLYRHQNKSVYDGDLFHVLPIFIELFRFSLESPMLLHYQWMLFDLLTAYFTSRFVTSYIALARHSADSERSQWLGVLAFGGYLLNPMTIGCWTVGSLSSFVNVLIAMSNCFMVEGSLLRSLLPLAFAVQLNPYYALLFCPIVLRFTGAQRFAAICCAFFLPFCMFLPNILLLMAHNGTFSLSPMFRCTVGFFLTVPDLTPNTGIFWYFFTQVFEHYRQLFLCVFQLNTVIYAVPFATLLRDNPSLLSLHFLLIVALFSPYPSFAETALYLPAMCAFYELHKFLRQRLIVGCALLATFVLCPIMWSMWVVIGSGNANFFFSIVWVFNLTQIFIAADLLSAFLRERLIAVHAAGDQEKMEQQFEGIRLISVSPF